MKNRNEKEIVGDESGTSQNDFINSKGFITPNQNIGRKIIIEKIR